MRAKSLLAGSIALLWPQLAQAEQEFSGNINVSSDYVWRGISQTLGDPAVSIGIDLAQDGFYVGAWASNVDFDNGTDVELDLYGGYGWEAAGLSFDIGGIFYLYPDAPEVATGSQDFAEAYAGVSRAFGATEVGGKVSWSPEFYGETGDAVRWEAAIAHAVAEAISVDAVFGVNSFEENSVNNDYQDFNVGVTFASGPIAFDVRFHDVTGTDIADDTVVLGLGYNF